MPAVRRGGGGGRGGFTFIELLVTITIIAILFSIGIGMYEFMIPESNLSATAGDIAKAEEQARLEAILAGRMTWFQVDLGDGSNAPQYYRAITEPAPGEEKTAEDDEWLLKVRDWKLVPKEVRIESISIGEASAQTRGRVDVAIQADGTMPSHLIRLWSPELDPNMQKQAGWACVQMAGLLGQARVLNRCVEPEYLREETFR
jgi:prepilin-type N-terminal cleavage/methylation domain-containing protein